MCKKYTPNFGTSSYGYIGEGKIEEKFAREKKKTFFSYGETRVCESQRTYIEYVIATVIAAGQLSTKHKQKQKSPDIIRDKMFWENGYQ